MYFLLNSFYPIISFHATGLFFVSLPNMFWVNLGISFFHHHFLYLCKLFQGLSLLIGLISQLLFQSCNLISHLLVTARTRRFRNTLKHIPPKLLDILVLLTLVDGFGIYMLILCLVTKYTGGR